MKNTLKELLDSLKLFAVAAAAIALFHYYSGFRRHASLLLGVSFTLVAMWLYLLRQVAVFKPYRLIIGINYAALWQDFKLSPAEGPASENYTFTAISPVLFARSDERDYSTTLDLYVRIPCAAPAWQLSSGEIEDRPTFFFQPPRDGYQFGLHVQSEWWTHQVGRLDPSLSGRAEEDFGDGGAALLAGIPI